MKIEAQTKLELFSCFRQVVLKCQRFFEFFFFFFQMCLVVTKSWGEACTCKAQIWCGELCLHEVLVAMKVINQKLLTL
jgi:hypothetical protein